MFRRTVGPLLTTVWQPPIGPPHASLSLQQPIRARMRRYRRLRANHNATKIKALSHAEVVYVNYLSDITGGKLVKHVGHG